MAWFDVDLLGVGVYMEIDTDALREPFLEWNKKGNDAYIWLGPIHVIVSWGEAP